ncbi:AIPR family protein [Clostridium sp. Marseille-QA1073]
MKYELLNNILEKICDSAPNSYKSYKDDSKEGKNAAKSKAFMHLYLKVKFGINEFEKRHELITDGSGDGGLDAYYIDYDNKLIYMIQSKFRTNEKNFEEKEITLEEIVKMENKRIIHGELTDSFGNEFNEKVKTFQRELRSIKDIARYDYKVIILSNLKKYSESQIGNMIGGLPYEVFDFNKTYNELVYPICTSTYYNENNIEISINLSQENINRLSEKFQTSFGQCNVTIIFVPVVEIGQVMQKYKNSILKYNPRNYLSLSKNKVNQKIRDSVVNNEDEDFAILNNGITILCDDLHTSDSTGRKNNAQIIITNPQFINGGQTAYTLSKIIETKGVDELYKNKKVMLKIITVNCDNEEESSKYSKFIEEISDATNMQSKVEEADRRSNEWIQIEIQKHIYEKYSLFYERKKGEFETAIADGYLSKDLIIDRSDFLRSALSYKGDAAKARASSGDKLFEKSTFNNILSSVNEFDELMIAYYVYKYLVELEKENKKSGDNQFGEALRYGKYAVVKTVSMYIKEMKSIESYKMNKNKIQQLTDYILKEWYNFEKNVVNKEANMKFFSLDKREYLSYYKSPNVNNDIDEYFKVSDVIKEIATSS